MKTGEFIDRDITSINKVITALKYLNQGRILTIKDYHFKVAETEGDGFKFMMSSDKEYWFGTDSIEWFSNLCSTLTDEEITIMQANMTLTAAFKTDRNGK